MELMGHRRLAGKISEQMIASVQFVRIDVPMGGEQVTTQFYGPTSVYCLTPTTEEIARAVADRNRPEPVYRWELPVTTQRTAVETTGPVLGPAEGGDDEEPPM